MEWECTKSAVGEGGIPDFDNHFLIIRNMRFVFTILHATSTLRFFVFVLRVEVVLEKRTCTNLLDSI